MITSASGMSRTTSGAGDARGAATRGRPQLGQRAPAVVGEERVVPGGHDLTAGPEPDPEYLLDTTGEGMAQGARNQPQPLVQRPDRDVPLAGGQQLAQRDLGPGVGAQDPGFRGQAAGLA